MPNRLIKTRLWPRRAVLKLAAVVVGPRLALAATPARPVLSCARAAARGPAAYAAQVHSDFSGGRLHWMVSDSAVQPNPSIIRAHNAKKVKTAGLQTVSGGGLSPATRDYLHVLHHAEGRDSAVLTTASFTTDTSGPLAEAQVMDLYQDRRLTMPDWRVRTSA